ncbi:MAG: polyphosphate kinase 1 [Gammaproteobacteria bacterium]
MNDIDATSQDLYINRELSLLEFNRRVLEQAKDGNIPLLERVRFLCISSTNLDEFFEIRVAGLNSLADAGSVRCGPDGMSPTETLRTIRQNVSQLIAEQYRILNELLIPQLSEHGIRALRRSHWSEAQDAWLRKFFNNELLPILSPLGLDPAHPFPRILNKSLNFIVSLSGKDAFGRNSRFAIVQVPRALKRIIWLPPEQTGSGPNDFVFLSSVIHAYVDQLFHGMKVTGCYQFRVTRNSDLFVDEEETQDLLRAVKGELLTRHYGDTVRLEVADNCPDDIITFLLNRFELTSDDLYKVDGPVNLNRLQGILDNIDRPALYYAPFTPALPARFSGSYDIFAAISDQDILLHHPFESFAIIVDFVRQAAADPQVLAIKQTLYRTDSSSAIVDALVAAARAGKEVSVVVELRARFDEEANVALATRLQEAGAHVVYGIVDYKTHAKMVLVVRRENDRLRNYVHLGTGNYHSHTTRLYTDYSLLTCDKAIGEDVHRIFLQLTSLGKVSRLNRLLQSPFTLHSGLMQRIQREMKHAREGRRARIIIKVNSLVEPKLIQEMYRASNSGVQIDLIVRGMCCLRPGIPGISENIRVRSIIGRFLEHSRVFYFENNGQAEVFCSSADWMDRNMFKRVEVCYPLEDRRLRERVTKDLEDYLKDNQNAWALQADGNYRRIMPAADQAPINVQRNLLMKLSEKQQAISETPALFQAQPDNPPPAQDRPVSEDEPQATASEKSKTRTSFLPLT